MTRFIARSTGNIIPIYSLDGYTSLYRGRVLEHFSASCTTGSGVKILLPANNRRISAIISNQALYQNTDMELWFGDPPSVGTEYSGIVMIPGSVFQIDALFPWSGAVYIRSVGDTGNTFAEAVEVSVP